MKSVSFIKEEEPFSKVKASSLRIVFSNVKCVKSTKENNGIY